MKQLWCIIISYIMVTYISLRTQCSCNLKVSYIIVAGGGGQPIYAYLFKISK